MSVTMRDEDRRAIDLLLDRSPATAGGGNGMDGDGMSAAVYTTHADPTSQDAIEGVERLLGLLSLLPAEEPPADLVERTLARCEQGLIGTAAEHLPFRPTAGLDSISHA